MPAMAVSTLLAGLLAGLLVAPAWAEPGGPRGGRPPEHQPPPELSAKQAAERVRRAYENSRLLSVKPADGGYQVRIDVEGRIKTLTVDDRGLQETRRR